MLLDAPLRVQMLLHLYNFIQIANGIRQVGVLKFNSTLVQKITECLDPEKRKELDLSKIGYDIDISVGKFRNLTEISEYLEYISQSHEYAKVEIFGHSHMENELKVMKICHGYLCGEKPLIYIEAGIHAREWLAPATAIYLISKLTIDMEPQDKNLIEQFDWFIVPMANPDGYVYSRQNESENSRFWRKNRHLVNVTNGEGEEKSVWCTGIDLNRNFLTKLWTQGSHDECSNDYQGTEPFSEKETRAIRDLLLPFRGNISFFIDLHTYSQMVILPWGFFSSRIIGKSQNLTSEYNDLMSFIKEPVRAMGDVFRTKWIIGLSMDKLYPTYGDAATWARDELGVKYSYTLELRPDYEYYKRYGASRGQNGFLANETDIAKSGEEVWTFFRVSAHQLNTGFNSSSSSPSSLKNGAEHTIKIFTLAVLLSCIMLDDFTYVFLTF